MSDMIMVIIEIFSLLLILFILIFCCYLFIRPLRELKSKNKVLQTLPILNSEAKLISKFTKVQGRYTTTLYFATFEININDRITFQIKLEQYGSLLEGETGILTYKLSNGLNQYFDFKRKTEG